MRVSKSYKLRNALAKRIIGYAQANALWWALLTCPIRRTDWSRHYAADTAFTTSSVLRATYSANARISRSNDSG